jgi:hypothetical protein
MGIKVEDLTIKEVREIAAAAGCCAPKAERVPLRREFHCRLGWGMRFSFAR